MAHPKRRQSKTRTAKRRTHDKLSAPAVVKCPECGNSFTLKCNRNEVVKAEIVK